MRELWGVLTMVGCSFSSAQLAYEGVRGIENPKKGGPVGAHIATAPRSAVSGGGSCVTDMDCELNGVCQDDKCQCDAAWKGEFCHILATIPGRREHGYRPVINGSMTGSWGGHAVPGPNRQYFMFAATFSHGCTVDQWYTNSFVSQAVADTPLGPFQYQRTVRGIFSHGPVVAQHNGTTAVYHVGCGKPEIDAPEQDCHNTDTRQRNPLQSHQTAVPTTDPYVCTRTSGVNYTLDGYDTLFTIPTEHLLNSHDQFKDHGQTIAWPQTDPCNPVGNNSSPTNRITNNAVHIFPNGSALMIFRYQCIGKDGDDGKNGGRRIGLAFAPDYRGPFRMRETPVRPIIPDENEDPFLWVDARGRFHALVHCLPYRGPPPAGHCHLFSTDSYHWEKSTRGPAVTTFIEYSDGSNETFCRRERPQLLVVDGAPTVLYSAVAPLTDDPTCGSSTISYTAAVAINTNPHT